MKDQVTSIEQSKRLVELGVPADKASMVYRKRYIKNDYVLDMESREMEVIAPCLHGRRPAGSDAAGYSCRSWAES